MSKTTDTSPGAESGDISNMKDIEGIGDRGNACGLDDTGGIGGRGNACGLDDNGGVGGRGNACGLDGCGDEADLAAFLRERQQIYSFLATVYREEVSLRYLELLRDELPVVEGLLGTYVVTLAGKDAEALECERKELAAEYARLLLAMSAHPVPPFESVYTSDKRLLMQEAWQQVVSEYAQAGFVKDEGFKLPEDHIALELEFMAMLVGRSIEALESNDPESIGHALGRQQGFLDRHLANWVGSFAKDLKDAAHTLFYQGVAELTVELINEDQGLCLNDCHTQA
ncbi:MAG: molecular chaperone TorD family protein [Coriobacteriaceae bacterium]|jgi:TorA maturation chaperone TorD|nr:molecular chaperone TorD family protein [Coriobacteriaceae bacterium]